MRRLCDYTIELICMYINSIVLTEPYTNTEIQSTETGPEPINYVDIIHIHLNHIASGLNKYFGRHSAMVLYNGLKRLHFRF